MNGVTIAEGIAYHKERKAFIFGINRCYYVIGVRSIFQFISKNSQDNNNNLVVRWRITCQQINCKQQLKNSDVFFRSDD